MTCDVIDEGVVTRLKLHNGTNFLNLIDKEIDPSYSAEDRLYKLSLGLKTEQYTNDDDLFEQFKDEPYPYGEFIFSTLT